MVCNTISGIAMDARDTSRWFPAQHAVRVFLLAVSLSLLAGCRFMNTTKFSVQDSDMNRTVVRQIVTSAADQFQMRDDSQRLVALSNKVVAAYIQTNSSRPITLNAIVWHGSIGTGLGHLKKTKKRTSTYVELERRLVNDFTNHFGDEVKISSKDYWAWPW